MKWSFGYFGVLSFFFLLSLRCLTCGDNLVLLSSSLRTYEKVSCDEELMLLRCPPTTTISTEAAQYLKIPSEEFDSVQCRSLSSKAKSYFSIMDVLYGRNQSIDSCQWPNSLQYSLLQMVVSVCQKKSSCRLQTSPRNIGDGDPCPNVRKFVRVSYKCRPTEFRNLVACEDEMAEIKCNKSFRVVILSGRFGRREYENVNCHQPQGVPDETCTAEGTTQTLMEKCHGKRQCTLTAKKSIFGAQSTCINPLTRNYLKVTFTCVPRRVLKDEYQGELEPDEFLDGPDNFEDSELTAKDTASDSHGHNLNPPPPILEQPSISGTIKSTQNPITSQVVNQGPQSTTGEQKSTSTSPSVVFYLSASISGLILTILVLLVLKIVILRRRFGPPGGSGGNSLVVSASNENPSGNPQKSQKVSSSGDNDNGQGGCGCDKNNLTTNTNNPTDPDDTELSELSVVGGGKISKISSGHCHSDISSSYDLPLLECDFCGGALMTGGQVTNFFEESDLPPIPPPPSGLTSTVTVIQSASSCASASGCKMSQNFAKNSQNCGRNRSGSFASRDFSSDLNRIDEEELDMR